MCKQKPDRAKIHLAGVFALQDAHDFAHIAYAVSAHFGHSRINSCGAFRCT